MDILTITVASMGGIVLGSAYLLMIKTVYDACNTFYPDKDSDIESDNESDSENALDVLNKSIELTY